MLGASELSPDPQGHGHCSINKTEHGHQELVHYPSGNVCARMTQPPHSTKRLEKCCSVPNSFQTIQNRPFNPSLMVTKWPSEG